MSFLIHIKECREHIPFYLNYSSCLTICVHTLFFNYIMAFLRLLGNKCAASQYFKKKAEYIYMKRLIFIMILVFINSLILTINSYADCIVGNCENGYGSRTWQDGSEYTGEWKDGMPYGHGTFSSPEGVKYTGELRNGIPHGQGMLLSPSGVKYIGALSNGIPHGQGTLLSPSGVKYTGILINGIRSGHGTMTWENGDKYSGEWDNGKQYGQCTTNTYGDKFSGFIITGK